jgi:hypothetical protein
MLVTGVVESAMNISFRFSIIISILVPAIGYAAEPVTVDTFVRAETDTAIRTGLATGGKFGEFLHFRGPLSVSEQNVIRTNRDTLYSAMALDLSSPTTITLPDADGRFMALHVINQDHYMFVETEPGDYELTQENVGTRFGLAIVRTFADPNDLDDIAAANAVQNGLSVSGGGNGPFEAPDWDQDDLLKARSALNNLATLGFDASYAFGRREEVRPIDHLVGAAAGWGGQPQYAAEYVIASVDGNDGERPFALTVGEVPVDAFWSVTVYNAEGYLEANELGVHSYNSVTAIANEDGSFTIRFGGCDTERTNCIPISSDWNYTVRLYLPRSEILDGTWVFPRPEPTN